MAKRKKRRRNTQAPPEGAVALHFDSGQKRMYVVLNMQATIVAVFEEDKRGWTALADAGYGHCPVYGPVEVNPAVIDRLSNVPKKERASVGQIMAGLLGKPLLPYLGKVWGGERPVSAERLVQIKQGGRTKPYDEPLSATIGSRLKNKLLQ